MQKFSKGSGENKLTFPLTQEAYDALVPSKLASPRPGNAHGLELPEAYSDLDALANEVQHVRADVARQEFPHWFMEKYWPSEWGGEWPGDIPDCLKMERLSVTNPQGCAHVVHMDGLTDLGLAIQHWLMDHGYRPKEYRDGQVDFLEMICHAADQMTSYIAPAMQKAFEAKYFFGVARPEEVLGYNMTHYPEGCPTHPEFPAGHGTDAGSTATYFIDNWDLDEEAVHQVRWAAYCWAMFRTFAGVHYPHANLAGMKLGGAI